jgi:hypothetical protein
MEEVWKDIPGYEGYYQASSHGNIRSICRTITEKGKRKAIKSYKSILICPMINKNGYRYTALSKENIVKRYRTHRLIAMTFIPNPFMYPEINHKDENKGNNHIDNLEWCTNLYNINYGAGINKRSNTQKGSIRIDISGENNHNSKLKKENVIKIFYDVRPIKLIAQDYNIHFSLVSLIKRKKTWKQVTMQLQ